MKKTKIYFLFFFLPLIGFAQPNGNYLYYDGIEEYVDAGQKDVFRPDQITVEMWVNPYNLREAEELLRNYSDSKRTGYVLSYNNKGLRLLVGGRGTVSEQIKFPSIKLVEDGSKWQHIAFTYDGEKMVLYKNGEVEGEKDFNDNLSIDYGNASDLSGLRIGGYVDEAWLGEGEIDEVRIWNKALTKKQINSMLYHEIEKAADGVVKLVGEDTKVSDLDFCNDLAVYYRFNETEIYASSKVQDFSCNKNDADYVKMNESNIRNDNTSKVAIWKGSSNNSEWGNKDNWVNEQLPDVDHRTVVVDTKFRGWKDPNIETSNDLVGFEVKNTSEKTGVELKNGGSITVEKLKVYDGARIKIGYSSGRSSFIVKDIMEVDGSDNNVMIGKSGVLDLQGQLINNGQVLVEKSGTFNVGPLAKVDNNKNITIKRNGDLLIKSDATGTGSFISKGVLDNSGRFKVERYVSFVNEANMASPMTNATAKMLGELLYKHLETEKGEEGKTYVKVDKNDKLKAGHGYLFNIDKSNNSPFVYSSTPSTGNVSVDLTSTEITPGEGVYYGWNLLGNPYPSAILWSEFLNENSSVAELNQTLQYLDGGTGNWVVHNGTLPSNNDVIPIGQGFFVQLRDGTSNTVNFKDSQRVHNNSNMNFGESTDGGIFDNDAYPENYLSLKTAYKENSNVAQYCWRSDATNDFDNKYDAEKLMGLYSDNLNVYFYTGDIKTSIQQEPQTDDVELGFYMKESGEIEFSIDKSTTYTNIILEDRVDNREVDLLVSSYVFSYDAEDDKSAKGRFVLHLNKEILSDNTVAVSDTKIYTEYKNIHINTVNASIEMVNVYDFAGRSIYTEKFASKNSSRTISTNLSKGAYIVKVITTKGVVSQTIILD